jgi:hypothetical protein
MYYLKEELTVGLVNLEKHGIYLSSVDFELLNVLETIKVKELAELNLLQFQDNGDCLEVDLMEFQQFALSIIPNFEITMLLDIKYILKKYYPGYVVSNLNGKLIDETFVNFSNGELTITFDNKTAFKNFAKYALSQYGFKPLSVLDQLIINNNAYCELEKPDSVIYMHDHISG